MFSNKQKLRQIADLTKAIESRQDAPVHDVIAELFPNGAALTLQMMSIPAQTLPEGCEEWETDYEFFTRHVECRTVLFGGVPDIVVLTFGHTEMNKDLVVPFSVEDLLAQTTSRVTMLRLSVGHDAVETDGVLEEVYYRWVISSGVTDLQKYEMGDVEKVRVPIVWQDSAELEATS